VSANKHVWFDPEEKKWKSAPFAFLPRVRHKPRGRRRETRDSIRATIGGVR